MAVFAFCLFAFRAAATTYYVDINSPSPTPPYASWSTAVTNIQDAINETANGDLILINPGVYKSGILPAPDGILTRVVVTNTVTLHGVNGPTVTSINGSNTVRCVYLNGNASLIGLTVTAGSAYDGAGLYCASTNDLLSNCQITGNSAGWQGGGVYGGILTNCTIAGNSTTGIGDGGGAIHSLLNDCTVSGNSTGGGSGGGAAFCTLNYCTVSGNLATYGGNGGGGYSF